MADDRVVGGGIFIGSIAGIIVYGFLVYNWPIRVLEATAFIGIAAVLAVLAWIGWTMASTPPPEPIAAIPDVASSSAPKPQGSSPTDGSAKTS